MTADIVEIADPAVRLYHRWRRAWDGANGAESQDDIDALSDESADIAEKLATVPARSIKGVWAKLTIAIESGGDLSFSGCYPHDCLMSAIADLERLAGEAEAPK